MSEVRYIAYYRVSRKIQELSHLGLDAQKMTVQNHVQHNGNRLISEFTEIESGRKNKRPELLKAIEECKKNDAILCVSKLDRLSRDVEFTAALQKSKVKFICCDMPDASELSINIFSSLAQWETKRISERIKDALAQKRLREPDWKPGKNNLTEMGIKKAHETVSRNARENPDIVKASHYIELLRSKGMGFKAIAEALNKAGYKSPRGNKFYAPGVRLIYLRFKN